MRLDNTWSFENALSNINAAYYPYGRVGPRLRNRQVEAWGQLVGRTRALILFDEAVKNCGSLTALGRTYSITVSTLRGLREFFAKLPDDTLDHYKKLIEKLQTLGQETSTIDAKQELTLKELGDKAEFVKDVIAMANNGKESYLIIGLEDKTFKSIGRLTQHYDTNHINQVLSGKIDPPIAVGYREMQIDGNEYAFVEIFGHDRPYIVARDVIHNRSDRKQSKIYKGTIYVRHVDRTEGISRAELEQILRERN